MWLYRGRVSGEWGVVIYFIFNTTNGRDMEVGVGERFIKWSKINNL